MKDQGASVGRLDQVTRTPAIWSALPSPGVASHCQGPLSRNLDFQTVMQGTRWEYVSHSCPPSSKPVHGDSFHSPHGFRAKSRTNDHVVLLCSTSFCALYSQHVT